ncbi:hypothetical protein ACFE04_012650 [Oxalis oulophora]
MAETAVVYTLGRLADGLQLVHETGGEVANLRGKHELMVAFLKVADSLEGADEEIKVWVKQIRDVALEAEDLLDEYYILKLSCCIKNLKARYQVACKIQDIKARIKDIGVGTQRLGNKLHTGSGHSSTNNTKLQDQREDAVLLDKTDLVGIDEPKEKLVKMLLDGGSGRQVVALTGMGGLGKTTLAKQVYDDNDVKKHFEIHAWTTVSRSPKVEHLLRDMVHQLFSVISKPVPKGIDNMTTDRLKTTIKKLLQKRRYLIVLDDVWTLNEWDAVKNALPTNDCASRVMITTRMADLDFISVMKSEGRVHNVEPLSLEQSWTLFCKKTFPDKPCPTYLEELCKSVLKKCGGLPLAIVAVSGVLATKDKKRIDQWEMFSRSLGAEIEVNDKLNSIKKVLSLSFNDLPYHLQSCFLYLSVFPEDHQIGRLILIRLWVAEGFVKVEEGKTNEEVADDYFRELLKRNLIQVGVTTTDGRVKTCRVHDFLREIIISKARELNFAAIAKENNATWPDKVQRLSVHNKLECVELQNRSLSRLRSFFLFGLAEERSLHKLFPKGFGLLGVLEMRGAALSEFPSAIRNLYLLKYLSLRETNVTSIPRFIGKLQNLETLDLKHCHVTKLPVEILKLRKLCHLLVYRYEIESYTHSKYGFKPLAGIGELRSLKKLCFVEANQGPENILEEIGKLTQLRRLGVLKLRKEDGEILSSSIRGMTNLLALSIISLEEEEVIDLQQLIKPPPLLQRLYLAGRLEKMPHWIPDLHSLVKVSLKWSRLPVDPLVSLEYLPNLVHLELLQVYEGEELWFKAGGFKKLKHLGIDEFDKLKFINVEVGGLPRLEKLSIQRCKSLVKVPLGVENMVRLKVLNFFDMPNELINSIRPDIKGEDHHRVKHIPEVYVVYWKDQDASWEVYSLETIVFTIPTTTTTTTSTTDSSSAATATVNYMYTCCSSSSSSSSCSSSTAKNEGYKVTDFMTKKDHLFVLKPTTTVDEALEALVDKRITGFLVIDDDWKLNNNKNDWFVDVHFGTLDICLLFGIILGLSVWYQAYYITTGRELAMMVGVRKAPILHHFFETLLRNSSPHERRRPKGYGNTNGAKKEDTSSTGIWDLITGNHYRFFPKKHEF